MEIRKTRTEDRGVYRYPINVTNGKGGYRQDNIIIRPGENEITEAWISTLHSLDDSEVYYNCKNGHPPMTADEKAARKDWEEEHPGEKYPTGWNLSLDYYADSDDDSVDKQKFLEDTSVSFGDDVSPEVEHLHELVDTMTDRQQEVYKLLFIEECSLTETAAILGMSVPTVYNHKKRILEIIKKNF
jgi:hypothetical protein